VAVGLGCSAGRSAVAGGGAATDAYEGLAEHAPLDAHVLADFYLQGHLEGPRLDNVALRAFDDRAGAPALNLLRLTVGRRPDWLGFRCDVGVGDTPNAYLDADPAATRHPELSRWLSYAEQAFATVAIRTDRIVSIDAGKFATPIGLEDNETVQNWNTSRGLLFTLAEPTVHTGVRATVPLSDEAAVSAFWLNGWNANVLEGSGMRSFAGAASWRSADGFDAALVYAGGLEHAPTHLSDPDLGFRHEVSAYASYPLRRWLVFAATTDWGTDSGRRGASWWGVGGYLRLFVLPWLVTSARGEHFADRAGFMTGTAQSVAAGTLTVEASSEAGPATLVVRLEARRDQSDEPVFRSAGLPVTHQDTGTLGLSVAY
jgi:hypothetical protein